MKSAAPHGPAVKRRGVFAAESSVCLGDQAIRKVGTVLVFEECSARVVNVFNRELAGAEEQTERANNRQTREPVRAFKHPDDFREYQAIDKAGLLR